MKEFPEFMKQAVNRIATSSQATPGVEGYVFDGADGSQMALGTCSETTPSAAHVHEFDEYMIVVEGCYTLIIQPANGNEERIPMRAGEECFIPRGVRHGGEVEAGTRTINAFGGHRANRINAGDQPERKPLEWMLNLWHLQLHPARLAGTPSRCVWVS